MAESDKSTDRQERLAAALRENLKRRKTRDRALAGGGRQGGGESAPETPGSSPNRAVKPA